MAGVGKFHCAFLTQKERDSESGLDYFLARYYSSAQGRFTSVDPARGSTRNPQSWNLYVYVTNNPLNSIDPFGLWKEVASGVWEWEEGDTWKTLSQKTGISKNKLKKAFDGAGLGPGSAPIDVNNLTPGYVHQSYASTDITPLFAGVGAEMNRREKASMQAIGVFAGGTAVVGGVGGGAAFLSGLAFGTGVTTLGVTGGGALVGPGSFAVIGEGAATTQIVGSPGAIVLNLARNTWTLAQNNAWIQQIIERRIPVFLASSVSKMADDTGRLRQFGREVQQLLDAGYKQAGQWLLPPK